MSVKTVTDNDAVRVLVERRASLDRRIKGYYAEIEQAKRFLTTAQRDREQVIEALTAYGADPLQEPEE